MPCCVAATPNHMAAIRSPVALPPFAVAFTLFLALVSPVPVPVPVPVAS